MKKSLKILLSTLSIVLVSCSQNDNVLINQANKLKASGASINLKIHLQSFDTKVSQSGSLAKKSADVKSFKVSLCTNKDAPESTLIQGSSFSFNRSSISDTFKFVNVPANAKPYYAVVSAYSDTVEKNFGVNINKITKYIIDGEKRLAVSNNSISVTEKLTLDPSDGIFQIDINLEDSKDSLVETQITPIDNNLGLFSEVRI